MKSYLLTFDLARTDRDDFIQEIDTIPEIVNWMNFFNNSACIISDVPAKRLTNLIRAKLPRSNFVIVELDKDKRGGWLNKSILDFIKNPRPMNG